jgi:hypothetical protein
MYRAAERGRLRGDIGYRLTGRTTAQLPLFTPPPLFPAALKGPPAARAQAASPPGYQKLSCEACWRREALARPRPALRRGSAPQETRARRTTRDRRLMILQNAF